MRFSRIFEFRPYPVSTLLLVTYGAISSILLYIHFNPPTNIPDYNTQRELSINMTSAWHDLQAITSLGYHPYNAKANDQVREYLLRRINEIVEHNKVEFLKTTACADKTDDAWNCGYQVELFDDMKSNVTIGGGRGGLNVYFEGTNIIVYVHGTDDAEAPVLVNAHYDSVSTGYGATDDGMATVSILQLLSHFTNPRTRKRKRGLIALLNNGEEDYLNGAHAFSVHPIASLPRVFLNLEGAGAGGRATLFRSTDYEVTEFYKSVTNPFGSVMSADGFKKGAVKSETDYKVFYEKMGMRGLDVAFWWPRSRYHTVEDDVPHTSRESLWHMLGTSISALESMMDYGGDEFDDGHGGAGKGVDGVWFDLFGRYFVLMKMNTAFIISVILLIAPPIVMGLTFLLLSQFGKLYMFSNIPITSGHDEHMSAIREAYREENTTKGYHGISRYPFAFAIASAITFAVAHVLAKLNPFIVYSSLYSVWALHITLWLFIVWAFVTTCDWTRPTALYRAYTWLWQFVGWWCCLVYVAVLQAQQSIGGGYFVPVFYFGSFIAAWISILEMFTLPAQFDLSESVNYYADEANFEHGQSHHNAYGSEASSESGSDAYASRFATTYDVDPSATESTPLFGGNRRSFKYRRTFANAQRAGQVRPHHPQAQSSSASSCSIAARAQMPGGLPGMEVGGSEREDHCHRCEQDGNFDCYGDGCPHKREVYGKEQYWSKYLPSWTWIIQFFVAIPAPLVLAEQMGLFYGTALAQTGADGNDVLTIHLGIALFAIIIVVPSAAFLVRVSTRLPIFCVVIAVTTLVYNLTAFPFSPDARLKVYFQQTVTPSGHNRVHLIGPHQFIEDIIRENLPSAAGKQITCEPDKYKKGLTRCSWEGFAPDVVPGYSNPRDWANVTIKDSDSQANGGNGALSFSNRIKIEPRNTRACKIFFDPPISTFYVHHSNAITATDPTKELRLWSRDWDRGWTLDVTYDESTDVSKKDIQVVCLWSDVNRQDVVPAFDEVKKLLPAWATVSKAADGLVELWL